MSVLKVLLLASAVAAGLSTTADAAPRARYQYQGQPAVDAPRALGRYGSVPAPTSGGGGYSSNPTTRDLQILSDKYKPGW
jgi:hypothetical protein